LLICCYNFAGKNGRFGPGWQIGEGIRIPELHNFGNHLES
jgi:hypothetical protein